MFPCSGGSIMSVWSSRNLSFYDGAKEDSDLSELLASCIPCYLTNRQVESYNPCIRIYFSGGNAWAVA